MSKKAIVPLLLAGALVLGACGGGGSSSEDDRSYDVSGVNKVDEIAALVPDDIAKKGKLNIGAAIDYAPAEFRAEDLNTAIGYEVDFGKAIGKVLGLETNVEHAEFASIIPAIGTKFDLGMSSFTITKERVKQVNMIQFVTVGSSFGVPKGNPSKFDPDNPCGKSVGVQTGTWQEEDIKTISKKCTDAGKEAVKVLSYPTQADVTTNTAGGKADSMYADSTVTQYAVSLTNNQIEEIGGVRDAAPQGVVVAKKNKKLTEAVQKAMQHLMNDGTLNKILEAWGVSDAGLTEAKLNPVS